MGKSLWLGTASLLGLGLVLAAPAYVMLNGAKLTREQLAAAGLAAVDTSASNGIVHVINHVLQP